MWKGTVYAEAATRFKNGRVSVSSMPMSLDEAKDWVVETVKKLIEKENELSMAVVVHQQSGACHEYAQSSWGGVPDWQEREPVEE